MKERYDRIGSRIFSRRKRNGYIADVALDKITQGGNEKKKLLGSSAVLQGFFSN